MDVGRVQKTKPYLDQRMDLTVGAGPAHHRDDREQDHPDLAIYLAFGPAAVRDRGKAGRKINRRHGRNPRIRLLPIDSEIIRPEKLKIRRSHAEATPHCLER